MKNLFGRAARREKDDYKDRRETSPKANTKAKSKPHVFVKTFVVVFLITIVISTPLFATVNEALDANPGGGDVPILEEELDVLIPTDSPFFDAFTQANRVNILAMGVDEHNLTDTIMLLSFDMDLKHVDIISIPRDTYYDRGEEYTSRAQHKINAAYRGNPVNTAKAVSDILMNIPINYYATVTYQGVEDIINAMGGVPMDIPFHMQYNDPWAKPPLVIDIPAGPTVLDGVQSVQFLRFREGYPDKDLGRIKAQQAFLKSAFRQSIGLDLPKIVTVAYQNTTSDITMRKAAQLASKAIGIGAEDITTYSLPAVWDNYYMQPIQEDIAAMLAEIYSLEPDEPESAATGAAISAGGTGAD